MPAFDAGLVHTPVTPVTREGAVDFDRYGKLIEFHIGHGADALALPMPQDFTLVPDYALPRTAGFGIKKDEPRFMDFANRTLLELEASGEAAKIFDRWFAPLPRPFKFRLD